MDAITLLTGDHNRVRGLFGRFQEADENGDTATAALLAEKIFTELEVHTSIEEEVFYPTVKDAGDEELSETVAEGLEEHTVAKRLMAEAQQTEVGSETWSAKMKVLIESVEHHAGEEEEEMFPKVRTALGAAALDDLGARLDAAKAQHGAPTEADKIDLTAEELKQLASDQEIPGRSTMSREQLLAAVDPKG